MTIVVDVVVAVIVGIGLIMLALWTVLGIEIVDESGSNTPFASDLQANVLELVHKRWVDGFRTVGGSVFGVQLQGEGRREFKRMVGA